MLKKFFLICSGADKTTIENCSNGEQNKYAGIGATVFFTAVMATITASYALYTVFDTIFTAIFFGFIWGLLIFNLDRFIVSTIKKSDNKLKEVLQATTWNNISDYYSCSDIKTIGIKIIKKGNKPSVIEAKKPNDFRQ